MFLLKSIEKINCILELLRLSYLYKCWIWLFVIFLYEMILKFCIYIWLIKFVCKCVIWYYNKCLLVYIKL